MKKNVGDVDRMARALFGIAFLSLPIIMTLPMGLAYYALSVAGVLVGASLIWSAAKGHCFVYGFLGFSTCKIE
jgi:Protein of unknown function (DUF2892)